MKTTGARYTRWIPLIALPILFSLWIGGCSSPSKNEEKSASSAASQGESPPSPKGTDNPRAANAQEARDFREIEVLYSKGLLDMAQSKMVGFERHHPHSPLNASVENLRGLILLRAKRPDQAVTHFKKAIGMSQRHPVFTQYLLYNLSTAQFDANQIGDAEESANQINPDSLDKGTRLKAFYLKANIFQKKSLPLEASRQLLEAGRMFPDLDSQSRQIFNKLLNQSLQTISDIPSLEKLYSDFEDSPTADAVLFRLGSQEMAVGNVGNGEIHLKSLISKFPQTSYYAQASEILARSQEQALVQPNLVGVLLPIKGKFAKFAQKSLLGIQLALGLLTPSEPDSKINIVVEDSGEEPGQAIKALDRLVQKHHVIAVIGPMLSKGVDQIAERAQELGVPLISLSRRSTPPLEYVFQAGLTQQMQAYEVAKYAFQHLGIRKFAIVFPNEKAGLETSQIFWDAVESFGGKIVGVESYNPGETDFRQTVDKLSGLYYLEARQRELDLLAKERDANGIKKRTRKTEQFFNLKPIVDYEAVFIPDEPRVAGQLLPTFAYRDVEHVRFLGTSAWNTPEFLTRVQSYAEHSVFVDAYSADSSSPTTRRFFEQYKSNFGIDPTGMEALAYDAALIVKTALGTPAVNFSRTDLRDRLKNIHSLQGVTGQITCRDGQFYRDLRVFTVRGGKFALVQ